MDFSMILDQLAHKYGTDKAQGENLHGYTFYYVPHLPKKPERLLEIGCLKGASLRMWREYFPECELHTIDLFEEHQPPSDISNLICHKGSQSNLNLLNGLAEYNFDVIIDDGSHNAIDIETSFNFLFKYCLSEGGLYVIEDLHCLTIQSYRYIGERGDHSYYMPFEDTILGKMKSGNFPHKFNLFDDKIAFIYG